MVVVVAIVDHNLVRRGGFKWGKDSPISVTVGVSKCDAPNYTGGDARCRCYAVGWVTVQVTARDLYGGELCTYSDNFSPRWRATGHRF